MLRVVLALAVLAAPASADTCEQEATELRAHLVEESHRASRWNTAWAVIFGTAMAGQFALVATEYNPTGEFDQDFKETLYVGGTKAAIGFAGKLVVPLRVPVPAQQADACVDVAQLHKALAEGGKREAKSFWLTHIGALAVNLAGSGVLTVRRSFSVGALSFAMGYPVGVLSAYTQPRRSWHQWRERRATWVVGTDGRQLWIGGEF
jgi:hypothetical protein